MINPISVDFEDLYQIYSAETFKSAYKHSTYLENSTNRILDIFKKHKTKATFFITGSIADKNRSLIKRLAEEGYELASHGHYHRHIFNMNPEEFEKDLIMSKEAIESISGKKIIGYRAPGWSLRKHCGWAFDILKKNGFKYDASINPFSYCSGTDFGIYPSQIKTKYGNIHEFPLSTYGCFGERLPFSGGLSLRLTPCFYIINRTKSTNKSGYPVMFYIHPWEFDENPVDINLSFSKKLLHYFNYKSVPNKLKCLLKRFEFGTIEEVLGLKTD